MSRQTQPQEAARAVSNTADNQHEATKAALRADLQSGRCGVMGATVLYQTLTVTEIVAVAAQVVKGRAS